MRRLSALVVFAVAWVAASAAACSETPAMIAPASLASQPAPQDPAPQDMVGLWRLSTAADTHTCLLALNLNAMAGGYGVVLEDCRRPDLTKARSWRMTPTGLELRDESGAVLARLHRQTLDLYKAEGEGPAYRMERAPLA